MKRQATSTEYLFHVCPSAEQGAAALVDILDTARGDGHDVLVVLHTDDLDVDLIAKMLEAQLAPLDVGIIRGRPRSGDFVPSKLISDLSVVDAVVGRMEDVSEAIGVAIEDQTGPGSPHVLVSVGMPVSDGDLHALDDELTVAQHEVIVAVEANAETIKGWLRKANAKREAAITGPATLVLEDRQNTDEPDTGLVLAGRGPATLTPGLRHNEVSIHRSDLPEVKRKLGQMTQGISEMAIPGGPGGAAPGNKVVEALTDASPEALARRDMFNDVAREAQIGGLETLLRELARDLGCKPDDYVALRQAIHDLKYGRNSREQWNAWIGPLADDMGLKYVPNVGHIGPVREAVKRMAAAFSEHEKNDATIRAETAALAGMRDILDRVERAGDALATAFEKAEHLDTVRAQKAAEGGPLAPRIRLLQDEIETLRAVAPESVARAAQAVGASLGPVFYLAEQLDQAVAAGGGSGA